ncbi:MAG: hypothetical protein QNJ72_31700 [Pleurocapsa sp. MO_226.B13]|nr:hypothetical protein [Pleurocapsa sp. MO_226.B13]
MSKYPLFTISVKGLTAEEKYQLISALQSSSLEVQYDTERFFVVDDIVELLALISGTIVVTEKTVQYSSTLYKWLRKRKDEGKTTEGQLKHPNPKIKPLDLENAPEEEIRQWIEEVVKWLQRGNK